MFFDALLIEKSHQYFIALAQCRRDDWRESISNSMRRRREGVARLVARKGARYSNIVVNQKRWQ